MIKQALVLLLLFAMLSFAGSNRTFILTPEQVGDVDTFTSMVINAMISFKEILILIAIILLVIIWKYDIFGKKAPGQTDRMIQPKTAFSNKRALWDSIRQCKEYIWWFDPYFAKNGFEALVDEVKAENVQEIRILSGLKQTDPRMRDNFKKFAQEMNEKGIKAEFRVIVDNSISDIHDRWLISKDICFNLPSINTIDRGQFSEIKITTNRPPFQDWWGKGKDIINDWNEIEGKMQKPI